MKFLLLTLALFFLTSCFPPVNTTHNESTTDQDTKDITISFKLNKNTPIEFFISNSSNNNMYCDLTKTYFEVYENNQWKSTLSEITGSSSIGFTLPIPPKSSILAPSTEEIDSLTTNKTYRIVYTFYHDQKLESSPIVVSCKFTL
ncbi:hypothetical protein [Candidatus Enterococcus mansonii]|uniref:DUF5067 domain-containing protein n=1 Tax=Candidatus Enterococcus mansonii TaxID=1834181 RepID=A0A242CD44_9ENTE|nr:hypothetical protein [Enterococcus sp. 4G2_DIV0659]OTO08163.1 hypothetical protein A5880_002433 [Enterococcus sp. 4G2_DIV0659]